LANQYQKHRGVIGGFCPLRIWDYSSGLTSSQGAGSVKALALLPGAHL